MNFPPLNILLLEDDSVYARLIREMLKGTRWLVHQAGTLEQGIEVLSRESFDLILLDLNLPDSEGRNTFMSVFEKAGNIPIIIMTGTSDDELASEAISQGAEDYLLKGDFSVGLLIKSILYSLDRRKAQIALRDSQKALETIINGNSDGMIVVDNEGIVQFANPAASGLMDWGGVPMVGRPFNQPMSDYPIEKQIVTDKGLVTVEMRVNKLEWKGHPAKLVTLQDVTERRKTVDELRQHGDTLEGMVAERTRALELALVVAENSRDNIDAILRSVPDGLVVTDKSGEVTLINAMASEIFNVSLELPTTDADGQAIYATVRELIVANLPSVERNGSSHFDFKITGEDGNDCYFNARSSAIRDRQSQYTGTVTIIHDVTSERLMDQVKTEFITTAAHELRTPLTSIRGFSEILLTRDDITPEEIKQFIQIINEQSTGISNLVNDLLDISTFESGSGFTLHKKSCHITAIVLASVLAFRHQSSSVCYEEFIGNHSTLCFVDPDKITRIMDNLISNALKYNKSDQLVHVVVVGDAEGFSISVSDRGIGMSEVQLRRAFDKFYRGDASHTSIPGTGLGLSIVKQLVEAHGGSVTINSRLGLGTVVKIYLPRGIPTKAEDQAILTNATGGSSNSDAHQDQKVGL